jgi:hypothetical protein
LRFLPELWKSLGATCFLEDTGVSASGILARCEIASAYTRTLFLLTAAFAPPHAHGRVPLDGRGRPGRVARLALNELARVMRVR